MGRIMAIDYGKKRCGIAVTDELCIVAGPLSVVPPEDIVQFINDYISKNDLMTIVVGLPQRLNQQETHITQDAISLKNELEKNFGNIKIELFDERFTSKMAYESLARTGATKKLKKNKGLLDEISAVILLQSYMQAKSI